MDTFKAVMFVNDRGESAGIPGAEPSRRVNLVPVQGANADLVSAESKGNLSGNFQLANLTEEAASFLKGGRKYEVTFRELS